MYFNARSIKNKFDEVQAYIKSENHDMLGITETWINGHEFEAEFNIPGYKLFHQDREHKKGGGVLLYVKNEIHACELRKDKQDKYDSLWVELTEANGQKMNVGVIYRPKTLSLADDNKLFHELSTFCNREVLIMGDFNFNDINWTTLEHGSVGSRLIDFLGDNYLVQHVKDPTRNRNILDLLITSRENLITDVEIGENIASSDHNLIRCNLQKSFRIDSSLSVIPDLRKANFTRLREDLQLIEWETELDGKPVDQMWDLLQNILTEMIRKYIPFKERRPPNQFHPKWLDKETEKSIAKKRQAYKLFKRSESPDHYQSYVIAQRELKKTIRKKKRQFEMKIANKSKENPKEFYSYIRDKKTVRNHIGPLMSANGQLEHSNEGMCNILNNYFSSVFTNETPQCVDSPDPCTTFNANLITSVSMAKEKIKRCIEKLKINKTPGPDGWHPRILKEIKEEIVIPLEIIFKKSVLTGEVPREWKLANVTPIFKKGDKKKPQNYRPISLTSIVGKIMETIIRDALEHHLESNCLINDSQHGFRRKRSCMTNLLEFYDTVTSNYDKRNNVDVIYLDFEKAFDTVPHERLLTKLASHGIRGNLLNWISNWLNNRKQRVVLNGKTSSWKDVTSGVPQGSVLGPLLFLIYINDLDNGLKSTVSKFADDTKLCGIANSHSNQLDIQEDLNILEQWSEKWLMKFNPSKCKVMHIGKNNTKYDYTLFGQNLTKVTSERDLGVIISNDLKPTKHCISASEKANKILGLIARSFDFKNPSIINQLYRSLVRPHLEYAVSVWSPNLIKDIDRLERVQRRATKLIPNIRNKSYENRLKQMNLFSLKKRRLRGDLIQVFKVLKGIDNVKAENLFTLNTNQTRNNGLKLTGRRFNLEVGRNNFANRVVNEWNKLPAEAVECNTVRSFKIQLDKHLSKML